MDYRDPDWVSERLGVDKATVYKFLQDGTIPAIQLGRKWLISESRLAQWMAEETDRQTQARRSAASSAERTIRRLDNLSPNARQIIRSAHTEARRCNHSYLGQEHLLLGFAAQPAAAASRALIGLGVDLSAFRKEFDARISPGDSPPPRRLGRTPLAKKAMRLAAREAQRAGSDLVRSEHLLLGLLLAGEGVGHEILTKLSVTEPAIRGELAALARPQQ